MLVTSPVLLRRDESRRHESALDEMRAGSWRQWQRLRSRRCGGDAQSAASTAMETTTSSTESAFSTFFSLFSFDPDPLLPRRGAPLAAGRRAHGVLLLIIFVFVFVAGNPSRSDERQGSKWKQWRQELPRRNLSSSFCSRSDRKPPRRRKRTGPRVGGGQVLPPPRRRVLRHQPGPARGAGAGGLEVARGAAVTGRRRRRKEQLEQAAREV